MKVFKNLLVAGYNGRAMATDVFYMPDGKPKAVVIYAHGFNGFKDWGNFDLIARQFASAGFVFVKFNFSHNGTTPETPESFTDLEAYAKNNYTIELSDLAAVMDWLCAGQEFLRGESDLENIYLLGHSLGGGIVLLKAHEDDRVKKLVTWASISECKTPWANWHPDKILHWKHSGVAYITNSRTHQQMPLYYQLYEDYWQNHPRLDIPSAVQKIKVPVLICHGSSDTSVSVESAYALQQGLPQAELFLVNSDHVFGRKHPWNEDSLPEPMQQVLDKTIEFCTSLR